MTEWNGFTQKLRDNTARRGPKCRTCKFLETLTEEGLREVEHALADGTITGQAIADALFLRVGRAAPGAFSINSHRKVCMS